MWQQSPGACGEVLTAGFPERGQQEINSSERLSLFRVSAK